MATNKEKVIQAAKDAGILPTYIENYFKHSPDHVRYSTPPYDGKYFIESAEWLAGERKFQIKVIGSQGIHSPNNRKEYNTLGEAREELKAAIHG